MLHLLHLGPTLLTQEVKKCIKMERLFLFIVFGIADRGSINFLKKNNYIL